MPRRVLAELAHELAGTASANSAQGTYAGVATRIELATRGSGSSEERWTYVDCALPPAYPFELHLERHGWRDRGKIERGEMVDVEVGAPEFDQVFLIEGAPADVVRRVLTPEVRRFLLAARGAELVSGHGALRLAVRGWLEDLAWAQAALGCTAAVAGAVRGASLALDAEVPMTTDGDAYRALPSDAPLQAAREARAAEVANVRAVRATRAGVDGATAIALLVLLVLIVLFVALR